MLKRLKIGQKVVHSQYGAGIVVDVREGAEDEEHGRYYVIDIPSNALKVHVPVDTLDQVNLRRISSKRTVSRALATLSKVGIDLPKDYRERRALVQQSISGGRIHDVACVVRDLCALQAVKKSMSTMELALLTDAKRRLAGELALVSDIDLDEAAQRIESTLHKAEAE